MTSTDIYSILSSKPHNQHYLNRYWIYVQSFQHQTKIKGVTEEHHICPKAKDLFPEYKSLKKYTWNGIHLTRKQHWVAHWILAKAYGNSQAIAFYRMTHKSNERITSKVYEQFRERASKIISIKNSKPNPKLSKAMKGKVSCYDSLGNYLILTKEEFDLRNDVHGVNKGMNMDFTKTEKYAQAISIKMKGRIWVTSSDLSTKKFINPNELDHYLSLGFTIRYDSYDRKLHQKTCQHCDKTIDTTNYKRWHGDNCKFKQL